MLNFLKKQPFSGSILAICASFALPSAAMTKARTQSAPAPQTLKEKVDRYVETGRVDEGVYLITRGLLGPDGKGIPSYVCPVKDSPVCTTPSTTDSKDAIIFAVPEGTEIVASASGTVEDIQNHKENEDGFTIRIRHWNGAISSYSRLSTRNVKVGDRVSQGEVFARSGRTGTTNTPSLSYRLMDSTGNPQAPFWGYESNPYDPGSLTDPKLLKGMEDRARLMFPVDEAYGAGMQDAVIGKIRLIFAQNRDLQRDIYLENLRRATDAWYANGKNWRKIPADIWNELTETDRGRLRDGVDPGLGASQRTPGISHN